MELKKEADLIMSKKGEVKGEVLRDHFIYAKRKYGQEAVNRIEARLKELGYELKFNEIKPLDWYPDAYCGLILVIMKDEFNLTDQGIYQMGWDATRYSFIVVKLLLRYLLSVEKLFSEPQKHWDKHLNFGRVKVIELNSLEKRIILRVEDYDIHPTTCFYQAGYYAGLIHYTTGSDKTKVTETKCLHKEDLYHEYLIEW
jgi:hypothetical protein